MIRIFFTFFGLIAVLVTKLLVYDNFYQHLFFLSKNSLYASYWYELFKVDEQRILCSNMIIFNSSYLHYDILTIFLSTTSINFLKSTEAVSNLSIPSLFTLFCMLFY